MNYIIILIVGVATLCGTKSMGGETPAKKWVKILDDPDPIAKNVFKLDDRHFAECLVTRLGAVDRLQDEVMVCPLVVQVSKQIKFIQKLMGLNNECYSLAF